MDGAHRVTALAFYGKNVSVALCKGVKPITKFDYKYFKDRGLSWKTMDRIAYEMVLWVPNMHVACLCSNKDESEAITLIDEKLGIVYEKSFKVHPASFQLLIQRVIESQYGEDPIVCLKDKSSHCYSSKGKVSFLFFVAVDLDKIKNVKKNIGGASGIYCM